MAVPAHCFRCGRDLYVEIDEPVCPVCSSVVASDEVDANCSTPELEQIKGRVQDS